MIQLFFPWAAEFATAAPAAPESRAPARRSRALRVLRPLREEPLQAVIPMVRMWDPGGASGRKCSPFARARTVNIQKLSKGLRQGAHTRSFWDEDVESLRPKTRADCVNGPRPCPWIGCRYHMAITVDVERGSIKETFPQLEIVSRPEGDGLVVLEQVVGTCALDVVAKHDDGTGGIGGLVALYQAAISGKPLGQTPGATIEEVGRSLNLSVERIRQLASGAMQEVRVKLRRLDV